VALINDEATVKEFRILDDDCLVISGTGFMGHPQRGFSGQLGPSDPKEPHT
jgi:hypothetical protein